MSIKLLDNVSYILRPGTRSKLFQVLQATRISASPELSADPAVSGNDLEAKDANPESVSESLSAAKGSQSSGEIALQHFRIGTRFLEDPGQMEEWLASKPSY
jgi:hypothetical protein